MAQVIAQLNKYRMAPRKVRAIVNLVKGKNVVQALAQLEYVIKRPSTGIIKVINSAVASAENNFNMVKDNLFIKDFIVNEGTKLKRFRPKGFGRASMIQKKTSHIKLVLGERVPGLKRQETIRAKQSRLPDGQVEKPFKEEKPAEGIKKPIVETELGHKSGLMSGLKKRFFQRKAV